MAVALLLLATAGAGYLYLRHLDNTLRKGRLDLGDNKIGKPAPNAAGQSPLNILLIGSDSRQGEENVRLGGARKDAGRKPLADVQMLVHVAADRRSMSVVSIPRDTRVTIPECTDPEDGTVYREQAMAPINQALQHGGPGCAVATWKELTGVYIDHFMMVDFAGVVRMADAIGGVPVCVDKNIYSHDSQGHGSGLKLRAGTTRVQGEQALQWLRTRYGFEDGSDIGRARAQHMYMNSMVRELKAGTKLTDPDKLRRLAEAAVGALTVDESIGTVSKLYDLANDLKRVPTERITMTTMPFVYGPQAGYVLPKPGDAEQVFSLLRSDIALDGKDRKKKQEPQASPGTPKDALKITVTNGTASAPGGAEPGRAGEITAALSDLGWTEATADTGLTSRPGTAVTYPQTALRGDALAVAKALGVPSRLVKLSDDSEQVQVVIGADWPKGDRYPEDAARDGNKAPESADAINGDDRKACMKVNDSYVW
ncbi:LCP family protein [Streptomyces meridianus]|uniref:LCP family protein n=1 Tax=Streptomyces meridianus TaxID=2938945 RepID=UPI0027E3237D|nr:LCP family protein [Streptomyces meridianus]